MSGIKLSSSSGVKYLGHNQSHTDLVLTMRDGSLRAHRSILSATCGLIKSSLISATSTRVSDDCNSLILLPDHGLEEAKLFLDVIYGRIKEASGEHVESLAKTLKFRWLGGEEEEVKCRPCYVRLERSEEFEVQAKNESRKRKINVIKEEKKDESEAEQIVVPLSLTEFIKSESESKVTNDDNGWLNGWLDNDSYNDNGYFDMEADVHDYLSDGNSNDGDYIGHSDVAEPKPKKVCNLNKSLATDNQPRKRGRPRKSDTPIDGRVKKKTTKDKVQKKSTKDKVQKEPKSCPVCQISFDGIKEVEFLKHLSEHRPTFKPAASNANWLDCPKSHDSSCNYRHPNADAVLAHLRFTHHKVYCLYCNDFLDEDKLRPHISEKHPGFSCHMCLYCSSVQASAVTLRDHIRTVHKDDFVRLEEDAERPGTIVCNMASCAFATMDRFEYINHLLAKHKIYMCPYCAQTFKERETWVQHSRCYHKKPMFTCRLNVFDSKEAKNLHILSEEHKKVCIKMGGISQKQRKQMCPQCGKLTTGKHKCGFVAYKMERKVDLPRHPKLLINNRDENGKWPCPEEGCTFKNFKNSSDRDKHFNNVHYRLPCTYCKKIVSYEYMEKHVAFQHTGDTKRIRCPECPEMFFDGSFLAEHREKVHSNKTFMCTVCGEEFPNSRMEQIHRHERHNRKRKFPCPVCGHIFRSRTLVKAHAQQSHGIEVNVKNIVSL